MITAMTYEDIIFLGKNKFYGSYILRKEYKRNVLFSASITMIAFVLAVSSPLIFKKEAANGGIYRDNTIVTFLPPPVDKPTKEPEEYPAPVKPIKSTIKFKVPIVVDDAKANDVEMPTIDQLIDVLPGIETVQGSKDGVEVITENTNYTPIEEKVESKPFIWVEEMPRYLNGNDELMEFFGKNIRYPEIARRAGVEGKVNLSFIVEKDGTISDISVLKGIGGGCDEEAVRVLKLSGNWIPGKQNGSAVRVRIGFPVVFRLN